MNGACRWDGTKESGAIIGVGYGDDADEACMWTIKCKTSEKRDAISRMLIVAVGSAAMLLAGGCSWQDADSQVNGDHLEGPAPRVFASTGQGIEPQRQFDLDDQPVVLQVVDREAIPTGALCQLRVVKRGSHEQAYLATWEHDRSMDQTSIVCRAKRFIDWRNTEGEYAVELIVNNRAASSYEFTIGSTNTISDQAIASRGSSVFGAERVGAVASGSSRAVATTPARMRPVANNRRAPRVYDNRRRFLSFRRMAGRLLGR